eukprot:Skav204104  [mRNA]  locus=scaffold1472:209453:212716:+ [translate_table: standard]
MSSQAPDIGSLVDQFDVLGALGCNPVPDRCNILVKCTSRTLTDSSVILTTMQYAVEGYGKDEFWKDHVFIPMDSELQVQTIQWNSHDAMPQVNQTYWLRNVINLDFNGVNYVYDGQSLCMPSVDNPGSDHVVHMLELYAGGYGGWRSAADFLTLHWPIGSFRSIAVEHDAHTAMSYAITNHAGFLLSQQQVAPSFFESNLGDWVICANVKSDHWKRSVAQMGIDIMTISSPCPAWSGASSAPGLHREDGRLLLESVLEVRFFRPRLVFIEQVSNFAQHPHRAIITRALHWIGYKIIFQRTLNVQETLHCDRPRFFIVAVRVHSSPNLERVPVWSHAEIGMPNPDVVFKCWTPHDHPLLVVDDNIAALANDPRLSRTQATPGQTLLDTRIYRGQDVTPTFMSMYGQQHELDFDYLLLHKFYGHYLRDDQFPRECRHWHPSEITLKHGMTNQVFQFDDLRQAWTIQGNIVTTLQPVGVMATQISLPSYTEDHDVSTQDFQVVLKAVVRLEGNDQSFWFAGSIPFDKLARFWGAVFSPFSMDSTNLGDPSMELVYDVDRYYPELPDDDDDALLLILTDQSMTLLPISKQLPVVEHPTIQEWDESFDQFGPVQPYQRADDGFVFMPQPMPSPNAIVSSVLVVAAMQMCRQSWIWNPVKDTILCGIQGDTIPKQTVADFWASVMTPEMLSRLGRAMEIRSTSHQIIIVFSPAGSRGVCTQLAFRAALTGAALKLLMADATRSDNQHHPFQLRWKGAMLWKGNVPFDLTVGSLLKLVDAAFQPVSDKKQHCLMHRGTQLVSDHTFEFLRTAPPEHVPFATIEPIRVLRLQGGGGPQPAKGHQRTLQQSALASMLLEHGFELAWVKTTVETLMEKFGLPKIQTITSQPMGGSRMKQLLDLCEEAKVTVPKASKPVSQHPTAGVPWKPNKRRNEGLHFDPSDYRIFPGFFSCSEGTPAETLADATICQISLFWLPESLCKWEQSLCNGKRVTKLQLPQKNARFLH